MAMAVLGTMDRVGLGMESVDHARAFEPGRDNEQFQLGLLVRTESFWAMLDVGCSMASTTEF
jgi:hypothetical protein